MNRYLEKIAEREGKTDYEVDNDFTPDKHSQNFASEMYKKHDYKGGSMFITGQRDGASTSYHYHPTTGLRRLKSMTVEK